VATVAKLETYLVTVTEEDIYTVAQREGSDAQCLLTTPG